MQENDNKNLSIENVVTDGSEYSQIVDARQAKISGETLIYAVCFGVTLLLLCLTFLNMNARRVKAERELIAQIVPGITADEVLSGRTDFWGSKKAPYTLVEFGDYECPPCRTSQSQVKALLKRYSDRVKLDFRHFPLTDIHPHAMAAGLAAETARESGRFWPVHEVLFTSSLDSKSIQGLLDAFELPGSGIVAVQANIAQDTELARRLRVNTTPSFFLCMPDGTVVQLPSLEAAENLVK